MNTEERRKEKKTNKRAKEKKNTKNCKYNKTILVLGNFFRNAGAAIRCACRIF